MKENDVNTEFVGKSMLFIQIENLPKELVTHKIVANIWDISYQPCKADSEISIIHPEIKIIDFNVSEIVHVPTISFYVQNKS